MRDRLISSEPVFDGRIIRVHVDEVETPDGHRSSREVVDTRGAVGIACVHDGELVLIRQYRHAVGEVLLEIPAGTVDPDERPEDTARRELVEEVGLRPRSIEHIATYFAAAGISNHKLELFFTDDVEVVDQALEPGEVVEIVRRPVAAVTTLLTSGEVRDSKTLIALGLLALRG